MRNSLVSVVAVLMLMPALQGCMKADKSVPQRDINAVLNDHDEELMAIPGVAGVYVGVLEDGKTPCLKVMLVKMTPELQSKIPKTIEDYPVVLEETGEIRPLGTQ